MGMILDLPDSKIHAEVWTNHWSVFVDFGKAGFDLPWEQFPELEEAVHQIRRYAEQKGYITSKHGRAKCLGCGRDDLKLQTHKIAGEHCPGETPK